MSDAARQDWHPCSAGTLAASKITWMTGSTRSRLLVARLADMGWGRMVTLDSRIAPYPEEPWGLDNGAYGAWRNGTEWPDEKWLKSLEWAKSQPVTPYLCVLPDRVADPTSLSFSLAWQERLPRELPWYLAVQDGMEPSAVARVLPTVTGLFLGGSNGFKSTARMWRELAHLHHRRFHYGRASTPRKIQHAIDVGADSADSAFMLWTKLRFNETVAFIQNGSPQLRMDALV